MRVVGVLLVGVTISIRLISSRGLIYAAWGIKSSPNAQNLPETRTASGADYATLPERIFHAPLGV